MHLSVAFLPMILSRPRDDIYHLVMNLDVVRRVEEEDLQ